MKGIIFDFSGVLADTITLHIKAWNKIFNEAFQESNEKINLTKKDYIAHFEAKPKYERLKNYLDSVGISIPSGSGEEADNKNSIYSLEKRHSKIFKKMLTRGLLHFYEKAVQKVIEWKDYGIKIAVVSSDENFRTAIDFAESDNLFDVVIEGKSSRKMGLKQKPEADIYIKAAKKLGLPPESCILFDDTPAGVQAGCKANFGLVIGVCHGKNPKYLSENGADIVIGDLEELDLLNDPEIKNWFALPIPSFASQYVKIGEAVYGKVPVLFLDYDGTLTPIVKRPEEADISKGMRDVLEECSARFKVAVVSGRDMDDLKSRIKLNNLIYAGSHGFRISGPDGLYMEHEKTREILPALDKAEHKLNRIFSDKPTGVQVERKRYAIAVHYRNAPESEVPKLKQMIDDVLEDSAGLKAGEGKKIIELKPDIEWDKGKAVLWILEKLGITDMNRYIPIYIGDDVTDEDAYEAIKDVGISIQVGPPLKSTSARFLLKNVYQVKIFLNELAHYMV